MLTFSACMHGMHTDCMCMCACLTALQVTTEFDVEVRRIAVEHCGFASDLPREDAQAACTLSVSLPLYILYYMHCLLQACAGLTRPCLIYGAAPTVAYA